MVFDATPEILDDSGFLKIGFAQAFHENKNDDNGGGIDPVDPSENFLDKLLPAIYAVIVIAIVVILAIVMFSYYKMRQKARIAKMSHQELTENAEIIMQKYSQRMDKKSSKAREKALKKWKKKNPHKKLEECNISQLNSSMFMSSVNDESFLSSNGPRYSSNKSQILADVNLNDSMYK